MIQESGQLQFLKFSYMKVSFYFILCLLIATTAYSQTINQYLSGYNIPQTGVKFDSEDMTLKKLFDVAECKAIGNIRYLTPQYTAMFEGGPYPFFWIETQPLGGVMYAKRDLKIALANILLFVNNQRQDGRIPAMVGDYNYLYNNKMSEGWRRSSENWSPSTDGALGRNFNQLQGFYLAEPALELYYLLNHDSAYLNVIYKALEAYDNYLWKYRDSDGDGCLETWCMTDNGEDHLERFRYAPWAWPENTAPGMEKYTNISNKNDIGECPVPEESMDVMGYSYSCRDVLAKISAIVKNGKESLWRAKANEVSKKMNAYLWVPEKKAYFYRDRNNNIVNSLAHNNIRTMYFMTMSQSMADDFIRYHLLNPDEFWTPMPLTSIAANDPFFRNVKNNNWSGQPQGLTYQRAIRALENYGHYAEVRLIGARLLKKISKSLVFTQQFDPYTSEQNGSDNYGPTILSVLEYFSRLYGVYLENDLVYFNGLAHDKVYQYTQKYGSDEFSIIQQNSIIKGRLNNKELFSCTANISVVTDKKGKLIRLAGIDSIAHNITLSIDGKLLNSEIKPNSTYVIKNNKIELERTIPFDYPYKKPE